MSKCIECGREMHPLDAQEFLECAMCRRFTKNNARIRDLNRRGTEFAGRRTVSSKVLGGAADMDEHEQEVDSEQ